MTINEQKRGQAMKEYFSTDEIATINYALEILAQQHEEKSNISNETGLNTQYKAKHTQAMLAARELKKAFI